MNMLDLMSDRKIRFSGEKVKWYICYGKSNPSSAVFTQVATVPLMEQKLSWIFSSVKKAIVGLYR